MFLLIFFIDSLYGLWLTLLINKTFEKNVKHSFNKQQQNIEIQIRMRDFSFDFACGTQSKRLVTLWSVFFAANELCSNINSIAC